jgi:hypothetical protein
MQAYISPAAIVDFSFPGQTPFLDSQRQLTISTPRLAGGFSAGQAVSSQSLRSWQVVIILVNCLGYRCQ